VCRSIHAHPTAAWVGISRLPARALIADILLLNWSGRQAFRQGLFVGFSSPFSLGRIVTLSSAAGDTTPRRIGSSRISCEVSRHLFLGRWRFRLERPMRYVALNRRPARG
jgi:hypothetical protein